MNAPSGNFILDAALSLAARGIPVFPCDPSTEKGRSKQPLVPKASAPGAKDGGLYLATTDEAQIRAWWRKTPDALIGMPTGPRSGVWVLDLDPKAHDAYTMLQAVREWTGDDLAGARIVQTQSGGLHLYFRYPDLPDGAAVANRGRLFNKAPDAPDVLVDFVDTRGEGGYVIAPPSRMRDGARYDWVEDGPFLDAPDRLLDLVMRRGEFAVGRGAPAGATAQPTPRQAAATLSDDDPGDAAARRYAMAALSNAVRRLAAAAPGTRNQMANDEALALGHLVGAGALSQSMAMSALVNAACSWGIASDDKAIRPGGTIERALRDGMSSPTDLSEIRAKARRRADMTGNRPPLGTAEDYGFAPSGRAARRGPPPAPSSGDLWRRPAQSGENLPPPPAKGGAGGGMACADCALTDLGNARRFVLRFGHEFAFVRAWGWLAWDGRRWSSVGAEKRFEDRVKETIELIMQEADEIRHSGEDSVDRVAKGKPVMRSDVHEAWGQTSQGAAHIACVKGLVLSDLERLAGDFDKDPMSINVLNGTLRIARHPSEPYVRLDPHNPADLITKLARVIYDPDATCPLFDRFIEEVHPTETPGAVNPMHRFLDQWGGLSLTGDASEQKLCYFYGKGRNGKSVWVDTVSAVAGDYADTVPIETFLDQGRTKRGSEASPDLAGLPGVRMLRTSEPDRGAKLAEALIKLVTGGEEIRARHLNKDFFSFVPQFKLTIQGNYRPKVTGSDDGIWGRLLLVPWRVFIPQERRDKTLPLKLRGELSGVLNRLLSGLCDWMDYGLCVPDSVEEETAAHRSDSDPLGRFLGACTRSEIGARVQSTELHRVFCAWAAANGESEWTMRGFGGAMRDRGVPSLKANVMWWLDMALTKSAEDFGDKLPSRAVDDESPF